MWGPLKGTSDTAWVIKRSEVEVHESFSTMSSHKKMKGLQHAKPRISYSSTTVKQQQNPQSERREQKWIIGIFLLAGLCSRSLFPVTPWPSEMQQLWLRLPLVSRRRHIPSEPGCPLLAPHSRDANLRLPDPSHDRCTSCTKLPVKAFLPGAGTELPKGRRIFLVPLGVNLSSLWQRTRTEKTEKLNQTKQIKLVTGD